MLDLFDAISTLQIPELLADSPLSESASTDGANAGFEKLFSLPGLFTLGMLVLLQAVLGFDNLLYISIESKRVPQESQSMVRRLGIGLAIGFRIVLLFFVVNLIEWVEEPFQTISTHFITAEVSGHSLIVLGGGAFILWTAIKEIYHLLAIHEVDHDEA